MSYNMCYRGCVTGLTHERRDSSEARVPPVPVGTALVITRYGEEKAVVLNPHDFLRLSALDRDLEELTSDRPALSPLALEAHAVEDTPGTPVENPAQIKALLGL